MTDTIEKARALLAHWRNIGWPADSSAPAYMTVAALIADLESARAELAAAREAILAVSNLINQSDGVYGLHLNCDPAPWYELLGGGDFEQWLGSLSDYHAAHPAASPAAQTPEQPVNGDGVDLEHGVPLSRGDIGGPSGFDAAFGSAPDLPEPCAVCSEALCECEVCQGSGYVCRLDNLGYVGDCRACNGTGRAGGGGHE